MIEITEALAQQILNIFSDPRTVAPAAASVQIVDGVLAAGQKSAQKADLLARAGKEAAAREAEAIGKTKAQDEAKKATEAKAQAEASAKAANGVDAEA
jgi:hypothetical protein